MRKSQSVQKIQQKSLKKEDVVPEKPKPPKIKTIKCLECPSISYTRFSKDYCRIPIPNIFRRMNEDLKQIFAPILWSQITFANDLKYVC